MPPPSYDSPASRATNSSRRFPAQTRCVWGSTSPGIATAPFASSSSESENFAGRSPSGPSHATFPSRIATAASTITSPGVVRIGSSRAMLRTSRSTSQMLPRLRSRAMEDAVPQDAVPQDAVPQDAVPQDAVPQDAVAQDDVNVNALESLAEARLAEPIWNYVAGGAADEVTLEWNSTAWRDIRLAPRALVDVSSIDTSTTLLGSDLAHP